MGGTALFLLIFVSLSIIGGDCKRLEGVLDTNSRWKFLTRFCFLSQQGGLEYHIEYPRAYGIQRLLFYYDTPGQWSYVYNRDKTCEQKTAVATDVLNYFTLDSTRCSVFQKNGVDWYQCKAQLDFHSSRERWWYLVVERCATPIDPSKTGLYMEYSLHLTNGDDLLHKEFSADQFYILPINIVCFIFYVIILILSVFVAMILKKRQLYHTTYAMYMAAVSVWTMSLLCLVIAWGSYGTTGWEMKKMEVFGRILQAASTIIFMLMLILMAKGYTIVRGRLTNKATVKITVFIMLYIIISITLFVWEARIFDEGEVLFYYENPAGYCMVAIQLVGWLWMTKAAVFTLKHYSNTTSKFYIPFYILFTIWFWLAPIIIMFAITAMPKWMREKTVHGVLQFIALAGHVIFLVLTRPSKANSNFPYNIKTSQIGIIDDEDEGAGDNGSTNAYSVNTTGVFHQGTGPNLAMFIVAKNNDTNDGSSPYGAAGYPRSHPPLDPYQAAHFGGSASSSYSDSPPPSYPTTMENRNTSNNISTSDNDNYYNHHQEHLPASLSARSNHSSSTNSNRLPPLARLNQLPPIGVGGESARGTTTTLPPIRGTGLPALEIEPSAPPRSPTPPLSSHIPGEEGERPSSPPDYYKLFQAK